MKDPSRARNGHRKKSHSIVLQGGVGHHGFDTGDPGHFNGLGHCAKDSTSCA